MAAYKTLRRFCARSYNHPPCKIFIDDFQFFYRYHKVVDITRSFGETEKLVTNIFELCGEVKAPSSMDCVARSRCWMSWANGVTRFVGKTQNYKLEGEKSFVLCAVHLLLAQNGTILSNLRSQNVSWEKEKERQTSVNLMKNLRNGLSMHTRKSFTGNSLVHQLPVILHLLEPSIRSVNLSLLSKKEKSSLGKFNVS